MPPVTMPPVTRTQADVLRAALEQSHSCATFDEATGVCRGCFVSEALAEAEKLPLLDETDEGLVQEMCDAFDSAISYDSGESFKLSIRAAIRAVNAQAGKRGKP